MEHGHDYFGGRAPFLLVDVHRDASAVVDNGNRVVRVDGHIDAVALFFQGLVDRVVYHFPDQMVQPDLAGRADVHRWPLPHRLDAA